MARLPMKNWSPARVTEPALEAARREFGFDGHVVFRGSVELAEGLFSCAERDIDAGDLLVSELHVADAASTVGLRGLTDALVSDDLSGDHRGLSFGEHARLRRPDARDVANRVHPRKA